MDLKEFLLEAKVNRIESEKDPKKLIDGGERLRYRNGVWRYQEQKYEFGIDFISLELVWKNKKKFWAMSTRGEGDEKVDDFLEEVLLNPEQDFPIRGQYKYSSKVHDELSYELTVAGDINKFHADEIIYSDGREIYLGECQGGLL